MNWAPGLRIVLLVLRRENSIMGLEQRYLCDIPREAGHVKFEGSILPGLVDCSMAFFPMLFFD